MRDLVWHSGAATPGSLFAALPGRTTHGRHFIPEALARGASLVLADQAGPATLEVEDPWQALLRLGEALRRLFPGPVLAVGGSSGKTTTKEALAQGLGLPAPPGNLNTAPPLVRFFWHLDPQSPGAVVELGVDRQGEMAELFALAKPHLAALTALAALPTSSATSAACAAIATSAAASASASAFSFASAAPGQSCPAARRSLVLGLREDLLVYGFAEGTFRGRDLELGLRESRFRYGGLHVRVPYPGLGPAYGALAALAAAEVLGLSLEEVAERLSRLTLPPGRMETREVGGVVFVNDAYNANPLSVKAGLRWLAAQPGRKWAVLGEMRELGRESLRLHLEVAEEAARLGLSPLYLGPHARHQAAFSGEAVESLEEALAWLKARVAPGDLVYLKASRAVGLERIVELWDAPFSS